MKKLCLLTVFLAVLFVACCASTVYVKPYPARYQCEVCNNDTYSVSYIRAGDLFIVNRTITHCDRPCLLVQCLKCGRETVHDINGVRYEEWRR